jgi:hypothetical protein
MRNIIVQLLLLSVVFMVGCGGPSTAVKSAPDRAGIVIKNAPESSVLYVDGVTVGPASDFNGKKKYLELEAGSHLIVIKSDANKILTRQEIFLDSEIKTIYLATH